MSRRLLGGLALLVVTGGLAVYGGAQLARVLAMRRELAAMERDLGALRSRAEELGRAVDRLRDDPAAVEQLAREDLGWVREGETVLKFPSGRR